MKIVHIGTNDELAYSLIERLGQEGNDIYLVADEDFSKHKKRRVKHRFYRIPANAENYRDLLFSIKPDCVIFAGKYYQDFNAEGSFDNDTALLSQTLRTVAEMASTKFLFLSSTEVYGNQIGDHNEYIGSDEQQKPNPLSERGIKYYHNEKFVEIYRKQFHCNAIILRVSQLYTNKASEGGTDFLSRLFTDVLFNPLSERPNHYYQPLFMGDFTDAVKRIIDSGDHPVYNVCSSHIFSELQLFRLIDEKEHIRTEPVKWEQPLVVSLADNSELKNLGWNDFRNLEEEIKGKKIAFSFLPKNDPQNNPSVSAGVRRFIENIAIFAAFFALAYFSKEHSLFSQINWLMIYVILIAVIYNQFQSALSAVLASGAYLYFNNFSVLQMNDFYSFQTSIVMIMEFVFLGLIVSYTVNTLREKVYSKELDLKILHEDYEDLRSINEENVLIKNEYEERLLTTETGFPRLYELVSRLMVEDVDRILMEIMNIISDMVHTDTVAVYRAEPGSPYLRLINAIGENSTMEGKSWNLSDNQKIYDAVQHGELYQGTLGTSEPAVVLPVQCNGATEAVILIKSLPFESETLYHMNLLKTLSMLLSDSMSKALQYEELSRSSHYLSGTDILNIAAFSKRIQLAKEKAQKYQSEFCVVELIYPGSIQEAAKIVGTLLRATDYLGGTEGGRLFALLNNTGAADLAYLQKRLSPYGVAAYPIEVDDNNSAIA